MYLEEYLIQKTLADEEAKAVLHFGPASTTLGELFSQGWYLSCLVQTGSPLQRYKIQLTHPESRKEIYTLAKVTKDKLEGLCALKASGKSYDYAVTTTNGLAAVMLKFPRRTWEVQYKRIEKITQVEVLVPVYTKVEVEQKDRMVGNRMLSELLRESLGCL